ncbi:MAG: 3-deoxy-D-manno-octulosonic acid transferase, partial [Acidithiobacillus sp.]
LVLIPRHPSRRLEVMARMQAKGVSFALRSRAEDVGGRAVFLIDTLGEVMDFYAAADVVTIGGSFVPAGGHNPLEASALARPVTFGPYMDNFKGITQDLLAANAAVQVVDVEALVAQLGAWLTTQEPATEMGDRALAFLQQQRGALGRTFALLDRIVP